MCEVSGKIEGQGETRPLSNESHPYGEASVLTHMGLGEYFSPLGKSCLKIVDNKAKDIYIMAQGLSGNRP